MIFLIDDEPITKNEEAAVKKSITPAMIARLKAEKKTESETKEIILDQNTDVETQEADKE